MTGTTTAEATITGRAATSVGGATIAAAAAGYAVLVIVARTLDPAANADFLVFWSVLFGLFGILGGVQQEATRAVGTVELLGRAHPQRGARVLPVALAIGACLAIVAAATSPAWRPILLGEETSSTLLVVGLGLAAVAYAGHCAVLGSLAGQRAWGASAGLIGAEALTRLALVGGVALVGGSLVDLELASAGAAVTWAVYVMATGPARAGATARGDAASRVLVSRILTAMVASTASAALVVGYPAVLRTTVPGAQWDSAAPLVLAISMTRAPLLMPLGAFQGVAIAHFLAERRRGMRVLVRFLGWIAAVGAAGAALAALVGPWLMTAIFGPEYHVAGTTLAGLTLAGASLALLTMTGSAVLALGRHAAYATGWVLATGAAWALLLVDTPTETRAILSLGIGPLAGLAFHLVTAARASRGGATDDAAADDAEPPPPAAVTPEEGSASPAR